ncbi:MAG TPA: hypothetical protein VGB52_10675 [Actinomycetota bacterium]
MRWAMVLIVAVMAVSMTAGADDIPDGATCQRGDAAPFTHHYQSFDDPGSADPSNAERAAVCVHAEGTTVFYLGGEVVAEEEPQFGPTGTCGSVIVLNEGLDSGNGQDWNNSGPDGQKGTADDQHCD